MQTLAPATAQERTQTQFWMWGAGPHLQDVIRAAHGPQIVDDVGERYGIHALPPRSL